MPYRKDPFVSGILGKVAELLCSPDLMAALHRVRPSWPYTGARFVQLLFLVLRSPNIRLGLESPEARALATSILAAFRFRDYKLVSDLRILIPSLALSAEMVAICIRPISRYRKLAFRWRVDTAEREELILEHKI